MNLLLRDEKADKFASLFQYLSKSFGEQVVLQFDSKDGMFMQCMDSSQVSITEIKLIPSFFNGYVCERKIEIGVSSLLLYRILCAREKSQCLQLKVDDDLAQATLCFLGDTKTSFNKTYIIPLINIQQDILDIPTIEYVAEFSLNSANFATMISNMKLFGDTVKVECTEEQILWEIKSLEAGALKVEIEIKDLHAYAIDEDTADLHASFSLNYLNNICQYHKLCPLMEFFFSKDMPLKIRYQIDSESQMVFYLASKIDDDEAS